MNAEQIMPTTYEQWRHCIEVKCNTPLTPEFIAKRITELQDPNDATTKEFARRYGSDYLNQVIQWFSQAANA